MYFLITKVFDKYKCISICETYDKATQFSYSASKNSCFILADPNIINPKPFNSYIYLLELSQGYSWTSYCVFSLSDLEEDDPDKDSYRRIKLNTLFDLDCIHELEFII